MAEEGGVALTEAESGAGGSHDDFGPAHDDSDLTGVDVPPVTEEPGAPALFLKNKLRRNQA